MGARVAPSKTKASLTGLSQLPSVMGFSFLPEYMKSKYMSLKWVLKHKSQEYITYVFLCSGSYTSMKEET